MTSLAIGSTVCSVCSKVIRQGDPSAPASHGIGPCCWDSYRASMGLKQKPYPPLDVPYVGFGTPEDDEKIAEHYSKPGRVEFGD